MAAKQPFSSFPGARPGPGGYSPYNPGPLPSLGGPPKAGQAAVGGLPTSPPSSQAFQGSSFQPKAGVLGKAAQPKLSAAALEKELGDLSKWLKHRRGDFGSFEVVLEQAVVRSMPSVKSQPRSRLKKGDVVEGEIRSEWLLLNATAKGEPPGLDTGGGEWVLIDGTQLNVGTGVVLRRVVHEPEVRREYGTAIEVGLPAGEKTGYTLDVRPQDGEDTSMTCPSGRIMMVQDLPCDCEVKLRFFLKDSAGSALAVSKWVKARTADLKPFQAGDEYEPDLVGNLRSSCAQCKCPAYVPDNEGVGQNFNLTDARCLRCGCNVAAHAIVRPEEEPAKGKASEPGKQDGKSKAESKPKPKPPPEPLLIDKAIALPKEAMMARWRVLDCPADQKEWPRLNKDYREVVAWSDLHADMGQNMEHLERLPEALETVLVLAGDLATNLEIMESSFRLLKEKFGEVFYVPGNHELWVNKKEGLSSVHKFLAILELCERLGVHTRPAFISDECAVCPLFSWYKDNLVDGFKREKANIAFDIQTSWPWDITGRGDTNDAQQHEIADWFAALNERRLEVAPKEAIEALQKAEARDEKEEEIESPDASPKAVKDVGEEEDPARLTVVTMSHFVPRQECYPGPRRLCGVMGCREIEDQVRRAGASCHIFGHSHIAIDRVVDHIRYVQHPLGYPSDYHRKSKPMRVWAETTASKGKDPEIAHQIALAEDGKWLVWNAVWGACNSDLADATTGPASELYRSKSKEDMERAGKHFKALKETGALELNSVQRLRDQARFAGRASAAKARARKALDAEEDIERIRSAAELDAGGIWDKMMEAICLAAEAVTEQCMDAFFLRKGDEAWEMNQSNWHLCNHYEPGKKLQADFEKFWNATIAPDPAKLAQATQAAGASNKKQKDPAKMREIALGGDAKWLVWNTVWYSTNKGLAAKHKGPARDQYLEKANEDLERREEHVNKIRKTGALSDATLARLQDQAENGGVAAADHAATGKELPALQVKALEPPPDIEPKMWTHMVRSARFAAQATCESSLDAYSFRKGDERWEMNAQNYHLCVHFHKAGIIQKRFESWWHNHVAPDPGENWEGASGIPEATLTKDIVKEFQDQIKDCKEKFSERPPGRWQDKQTMWEDSGNVLNRKKEAELKADMGADETELWSAQKPTRDLDVKITSLEDPTHQIAITISNELLVKQLKEAIVEKVGRGPASKITLSTSGENTLEDDMMLSYIEEEVDQGLMLHGLDISQGREVELRIVHAASDVPQSLVLTVLDTATIVDVRRAIKERLQERALSACKLVKQLGNGFSSLKDDEKLNGRTELLFLGRELPAASEEKAPEPKMPDGSPGPGKQEAEPPKRAEEGRPRAKEPAPPAEVTITITHAMAGCTLQLTVPSDATYGDVRRALMARLDENRLSQVKLVKRRGGEDGIIVALSDSDRLNGKTSLLSMGREWDDAPATVQGPLEPEPPAPQEEPAAPPAPVAEPEPPTEMTVTIHIDRAMELKSEVSIMSGIRVLQLKEQIAADDPTGSTSVDEFGLKLPGSGDPLPDDALLTVTMTELEICL
mmetsp:Transcript_57395/g.170795  ORF Transcript_57395/g.170795 Transcript_57395/m.170795 type:complete len:1558 (-) Transcript_57395:182-4855(-)